MNPPGAAGGLLLEMREKLDEITAVDLIICPPFTALDNARQLFQNFRITIGAQNLFWEDKGAYTGEISASMLSAIGVEYVIIGHSERRQYFDDTDETVNKRMKAALKAGLKPILCLGETESEREDGITFEVVRKQFRGALEGIEIKELKDFMIAYEPVWAIGTGKTAKPADAQEVHELLRKLLAEKYTFEFSESTRILYGGSVKPDNAEGLFRQPDIDGALIGGASLSTVSFRQIAEAAEFLTTNEHE